MIFFPFPYIFEPFRGIYEQFEQELAQKIFGAQRHFLWPMYLPVWQQISNHFLLQYWVPKYIDILTKQKRRNYSAREIQAIKDPSKIFKSKSSPFKPPGDPDKFKTMTLNDAKKLINHKRVTSPEKYKVVREDYKRILKDAGERLISAIHVLKIFTKAEDEGRITREERADFVSLMAKDFDSPLSFGKLEALLKKFKSGERNTLISIWGEERHYANRYGMKVYKEALEAVLLSLDREYFKRIEKKWPWGHKYKTVEDYSLHLLDLFDRDKGSLWPYAHRSIVWEISHNTTKEEFLPEVDSENVADWGEVADDIHRGNLRVIRKRDLRNFFTEGDPIQTEKKSPKEASAKKRIPINDEQMEKLSRREKKVAKLLNRFFDDKRIAAEMKITAGGARKHMSNINKKLR